MFSSLAPISLLKKCFQTKVEDPYQDLIDQLIALVEGDFSMEEDQPCPPAESTTDWIDISNGMIEIIESEATESSTSSKSAVSGQDQFTPLGASSPQGPLISNEVLEKGKSTDVKEKDLADQPSRKPNLSSLSLQNGPNAIKAPGSSSSNNESPSLNSLSDSKESNSDLSIRHGNSSEQVNRDHQSSSSDSDQASKKRLANRLDVSRMAIQPALVVVIEDKGWKQDGQKSKRIFDSIYDTLGQNKEKIVEIIIEENCIKLYTDDVESRAILSQELKAINPFVRETSPFQLYVQNPLKPSIQFLCCAETYKMPSSDLIAQLREENNWKSEWTVNIESKEWIRKLRKAKLSLIVDSRIRDKLEMDDGMISVGGKETKVFDKFGIVQCSVCLRFGHSKCRSRVRCFFCSGFHSDKFRHDKYTEKKYCFLCRMGGHAPIAKNCFALIREIRAKLELIDYKYKDIFVGTDRSY